MKTRVQSLNAAGIEVFLGWLRDPKGPPPKALLVNPAYCDELSFECYIDASKSFETSFELGRYLHEDVFKGVTDTTEVCEQNGLWAWISLAFIDSLLSRKNGRANRPLDVPHYVELPTPHGRRLGYRLIARTSWRLVRLHGEFAEVAIGSKRSPWGEMAEQMTSRQEIFSHPSFWKVAYRLYRNSRGELRRGATTQRPPKARKDPKNNAGKGSVRRLPSTFRQFDRTYLTRAMSLGQMLEFLPREYEKWVKEA